MKKQRQRWRRRRKKERSESVLDVFIFELFQKRCSVAPLEKSTRRYKYSNLVISCNSLRSSKIMEKVKCKDRVLGLVSWIVLGYTRCRSPRAAHSNNYYSRASCSFGTALNQPIYTSIYVCHLTERHLASSPSLVWV